MKKVFPFAIILLLAGAGIFAYSQISSRNNQTQTDKTTNNQKQTKDNQDQETSFSGSIKDVLSRNKAVKCQYSGADPDGNTFTGIIYVDNNKLRQTMEYTEDNQKQQSEIIVADQIYMWQSSTPNQGIILPINDNEDKEGESLEQDLQEFYKKQGLDYNYEFKCQNWKADQSKFTPPKDVTFTDMTQMMQQFQQQP